MASKQCAGTTVSSENLEDSWRETSLFDEGTKGKRREGRLFGWLENEAVTCCESGCGFETDSSDRSIPRDDTGCHSQRLVADNLEEAVFLRPGFTTKFVDKPSIVSEYLCLHQ